MVLVIPCLQMFLSLKGKKDKLSLEYMSNNSKPRASICEKAEAAAHCCVLGVSDPLPMFTILYM